MKLPNTLLFKLGSFLSLLLTLPGMSSQAQSMLPNDAAVEAIYTLDQLPLQGGPHVVRALIRNVGTRAIMSQTVTLQVAGATTFATTAAVASLTPNATAVVSFPAFTPAAVGSQSLLVSLNNDDDSNNNSLIASQEVTAATASYITTGMANNGSLGYPAGGTLAFVAQFEAAGPRDVVQVRAFLTSVSSVGQTVYGVVADRMTGAVLGRSADYVITTADIGTLHTFSLSPAVPVPGGSYLAGMAQVTNPAQPFFPMGVQTERPTRPGTFFGLNISSPGPPNDLSNSSLGRLMLETVLAPPATCPAPGSVRLTGTQTTATVSFTGPVNASGYQVVYGSAGFNPATGGTTLPAITSPLTVNGLSPFTHYDFYVRALCGATDQSTLTGPVSLTTPCTPPILSASAYQEDFNTVAPGQTLPCGIQVQDVNGDANTWQARATVPTQTNPRLPIGRGGSGNAMVYYYNEFDSSVGGNDWFYTPALRMTAGQTYTFSFYYRSAGPGFPEALEVKYGSTATPAGQTSTLFTNRNITNTTYVDARNPGPGQPVVLPIRPTATGIYYIGFHAISTADQYFLAVDDISVSGPTATSEALPRAVQVFPNPSASGRFSLLIQGANGGTLGVEVGQSVYTGQAKDNFTNDLNLTHLAAGLYTLKVKKGEEYTIQRIAIVK